MSDMKKYLQISNRLFESADWDDDEDEDHEFSNGDRVKFKGAYDDGSGEVFTLSSWDGTTGWVLDDDGRGWSVKGFQIEPVYDDEYDDSDEYDESLSKASTNETFVANEPAAPEEHVTFSKTKASGTGSVTISGNAESIEELQELLTLAGIDPSALSAADSSEPAVHGEIDPYDAGPADDEHACGCGGATDSDMTYSTDKQALVDMLKQKLSKSM